MTRKAAVRSAIWSLSFSCLQMSIMILSRDSPFLPWCVSLFLNPYFLMSLWRTSSIRICCAIALTMTVCHRWGSDDLRWKKVNRILTGLMKDLRKLNSTLMFASSLQVSSWCRLDTASWLARSWLYSCLSSSQALSWCWFDTASCQTRFWISCLKPTSFYSTL
jgi:hypothetical protein